MSDNHPPNTSDPFWREPDGARKEEHTLPEDLSTVDALLRADSAAWVGTLPSAERVARYAATMPSLPAPAAPPVSRPAHLRERALPALPSQPLHPIAPAPRRIPAWLALIAAVLVVALFASVFASMMRSRSSLVNPTPSPWVRAENLSKQPSIPVLAPSNPQVVYETAGSSVRRSDDAGATWQAFAVPRMGPAMGTTHATRILISETDASLIVVETTANRTGSGTPCPQGTSPIGIGNITCVTYIASSDGGAHWNAVSLPTAGSLAGTSGVLAGLTHVLQVRGGKLYAAVAAQQSAQSTPTGGTARIYYDNLRLITSSDGIHWSLADATLASQVPLITQYALAPDGHTIYALSVTDVGVAISPSPTTIDSPATPVSQAGTSSTVPSSAFILWQSTDDGQHWQQMNTVLAADDWLLGVAPQTTGGASPVVYREVVQPVGHFQPSVSDDGGRTWSALPATGIPSTYGFSLFANTTPNGGIALAYWDAQPIYTTPTGPTHEQHATQFHSLYIYAWSPGAGAWRQLSESLAFIQVRYTLVAPDASGQTRLWVVAQDSGSAPNSSDARYTVYSVPLK